MKKVSIQNVIKRKFQTSYPPYVIMHALLFPLLRRAIGVEFPGAEVFVKGFEVGVPLKYCRIDGRKHVFRETGKQIWRWSG